MKQSLDFPKPRLCPVTKVLYLYDLKFIMSAKIHFRYYNPKQPLLFPHRLDKAIPENHPVRVVDT